MVEVDQQGKKWYHMGRKSKAWRLERLDIEQGKTKNDKLSIEDAKEMMEDLKDDAWLSITTDSAGTTTDRRTGIVIDSLATDDTYAKLQQAYDAVECTQKGLKKHALALRGKVDTTTVQAAADAAKKAMTISEELEALLFADRSTVKENDLRMTLQKAGGLYQQIRLKELEIDSLFKTFCKKSASSSKDPEAN